MKRVVIMAEKPSLFADCQTILSPFLQKFAGAAIYHKVDVVIAHHYSFLRYIYPKGLKWDEYPFVGEPIWELEREACTRWSIDAIDVRAGEITYQRSRQLEKSLQGADIVVSLTDWSASSQCFARALVDRYAPHAKAYFPQILNSTQSSLLGAFEELLDAKKANEIDSTSKSLARAGTVKMRFDYNFNINSLAILSKTYFEALGRRPVAPLSKYAVQFLFRCSELAEPLSEGDLIREMQEWKHVAPCMKKATKLFDDGLGSCASRAQIVSQCEENGLLEKMMSDGSRPQKLLALSSDGRMLLDWLHPDCRDYDLPYRLSRWMNEEDSNCALNKVDRYIRTFFGKQIRFLSKKVQPCEVTTFLAAAMSVV